MVSWSMAHGSITIYDGGKLARRPLVSPRGRVSLAGGHGAGPARILLHRSSSEKAEARELSSGSTTRVARWSPCHAETGSSYGKFAAACVASNR